ncbi:MAG: hypothetical protein OXU66_10725 [Gammaproteobacteria bacterium]|nr:hypothetical protein [Gammaproteobacteria bacterium]MDD9895898.1 hypothetical protein [Gammaproteobacteria bacterium]MDD9959404.1 hypothetical protein [Gammaproteobacteria bacterium]
MKNFLSALGLILILTSCESFQPPDDGIPRIRSQADVDAYNATVSGESNKLVCTRERVIGSNIRQFVCMTVAQRERIAEQAREDVRQLSDELQNVVGN